MITTLLRAALYAAVGVIKGQRLLWDAVDDVTAWFVGLGDWADPGCDHEACPDTVPLWMDEEADLP